MGVEQSGRITPGHLVIWVAPGVIGDGGAAPTSQKVLAKLPSAAFDSTGDQPILIPNSISAFQITAIVITNANIDLDTAQGGFFPEAAQGGTPIVAATQVYSTLDAPTKLLNATLSADALTTRYSRANLPDWAIYFALTSAQALPATADIYIVGVDLTI